MEASRLLSGGSDRQRMLDMDRRLRPLRRKSFAILALALVASGPWLGWWTLLPLALAAVVFGYADRRTERMRRPEYAMFAAWVASEVIIAISVAITGGPTVPTMSWLALPMVTLAARFDDRGIALGVAIALGLLLAVGFGVDAAAVLEDPPLLIAPASTIIVVTIFAMALMRSDVEHRSRALLDPLTGMLNRTALAARTEEIAQQSALSGDPVGLVLIDIDRFKAVNDLHGHSAGDAVLRHTAYVIRKQLRAFDLAYRVGGEEFLVLLPGAGFSEAIDVARLLCRSVEAEVVEGLRVTVSCGVAASRPGTRFDFDAAFTAADAGLYEAKARGRNCVGPRLGTAGLGDPAAPEDGGVEPGVAVGPARTDRLRLPGLP
jgi:diguanylate cyclase (GGDEF)-like protein